MGLRDIRKRIKSVKNTRQITKAMKMVSAAKLRKAQDNVIAARPYASTLDAVMAQLLSKEPGEVSHPLLTRREVKRIEFIVVSSDRGLAGGFNSNITRVGRKAGDFLRGRGYTIRKDWPGVLQKLSYAAAESIAAEVTERFLTGQVDAVYFLFNEFISAISQVPNLQQLLPFEPKADAGQKPSGEYAYEPNAQAVLEKLIPQAVNVKVYRGLLESWAAEHAARMAAMENATKNAGDMIGTLTLFYNRTRQALITKELMEIVSGAEALKG
jgi:F-type H+-transporting ATPase subunit gamma